ncbi:MAG: MBL fold metallo-hydrolase [Culicoidibacterales bacterium]
MQAYAKRADEEQLESIEKEVQKYQKYVQTGYTYQAKYQKGDKTLQKIDFQQKIVLKERVVHDSPFSIRVLLSSSSGNLSLLHVDGQYYLIDCGVSKSRISQILAENGIDLNDLAGIFITHNHSDHVKGLAMLTKYHHMPVHLSAGTAAEITARKDFQRSGRKRNLQIWTENELTLEQLHVIILPTSHDTTDSCGFKFSYQGQSLVYLTDLGTIDQTLLQQATGAHCYVFESNHEPELLAATNRPIYLKKRIASDRGHLNNTQSAQYLQQLITQATQTIILAHLSLEANTHEQAQKIFEQYNADFTGTLQIAQPHDALAWTEIR